MQSQQALSDVVEDSDLMFFGTFFRELQLLYAEGDL